MTPECLRRALRPVVFMANARTASEPHPARIWHRWKETICRWLGPSTELMLDLARVSPGHHVLDYAVGDGYAAVKAAARVGPIGRVVAIDLAPPFFAFAGEAVREAGLKQVIARTRAGDAASLPVDEPLDAVICRFGL